MSDLTVWGIIFALGVGTFLIRFSFLGALGKTQLPPLVLRLLRFTPVAMLPALVAPLVVWPAATGGQPDPARLSAAAVTLAVGVITKNVLAAILSGGLTLFGVLYFLG